MAEAPAPAGAPKKEEKKGPKITAETMIAEIVGALIVIFLLSNFLKSINSGSSDSIFTYKGFSAFLKQAGVLGLFESTVTLYIFLAAILSMLFIFGIIYTLLKIHAMEKVWYASLYPSAQGEEMSGPKNQRWERVVAHISSSNPSDWRLAILECDIILDEVLDKVGLYGDSIGDRLKNADPAHFRTLQYAWEAHKIRNAIAHEGQDFTLTHREARRIVGLYEAVFREFEYI